MKVEGLSDKAMRFQLDKRYFDTPTASDSGILIRFREAEMLNHPEPWYHGGVRIHRGAPWS